MTVILGEREGERTVRRKSGGCVWGGGVEGSMNEKQRWRGKGGGKKRSREGGSKKRTKVRRWKEDKEEEK